MPRMVGRAMSGWNHGDAVDALGTVFSHHMQRQTVALESIAASLAVIADDIAQRREQQWAEVVATRDRLQRDYSQAVRTFGVYDHAQTQVNGRRDKEALQYWEREAERLDSELRAFEQAHPELARVER
jgi:hypothetical protein